MGRTGSVSLAWALPRPSRRLTPSAQSRLSFSSRWTAYAPITWNEDSRHTCSTSRERDWCAQLALTRCSASADPTRSQRADYLQPVFPSLTFVNHWSILTGLYPSSHGIVANDFYDPALDKEFVYTEPSKSWAPEWWGGEPIWSTAVKNGLRSAVLMWPGRLPLCLAPRS